MLERAAFLDLEQGKIGLLVRANHGRGQRLAFRRGDGHLARALNHVIVGNQIAVSRDKESRSLRHAAAMRGGAPAARTILPLRAAKLAEEFFHRVFLASARRIARLLVVSLDLRDLDLDRHDRALYALDHIGERYRAGNSGLCLRCIGGRRHDKSGVRQRAKQRGGGDRSEDQRAAAARGRVQAKRVDSFREGGLGGQQHCESPCASARRDAARAAGEVYAARRITALWRECEILVRQYTCSQL